MQCIWGGQLEILPALLELSSPLPLSAGAESKSAWPSEKDHRLSGRQALRGAAAETTTLLAAESESLFVFAGYCLTDTSALSTISSCQDTSFFSPSFSPLSLSLSPSPFFQDGEDKCVSEMSFPF